MIRDTLALTTLVRYNCSMTTLTIRIEDDLKSKAALQADKFGIPLTLIVKNALISFVKSPKIIIGEAETIVVTPDIQAKMDKIGDLLSDLH